MGFKNQKRERLGSDFRIILRKSGINYSSEYKENQTSKTANGEDITTSQLSSFEFEKLLVLANNSMKKMRATALVFFASLVISFSFPQTLILTAISLAYGVYLYTKGTVKLNYSIDAELNAEIAKRINPLVQISKSKKTWKVTQSSRVLKKKYQAGAGFIVKRNQCTASSKIPFPFETNAQVVSFRSKREVFVFLPDKLFTIRKGKVEALNYSDVVTSIKGQRFIENKSVPKDAKIVDYTWQYVNKDGSPDKRFKGKNRKFPVCLYGEMSVTGTHGLNTVIMFSNSNIDNC